MKRWIVRNLGKWKAYLILACTVLLCIPYLAQWFQTTTIDEIVRIRSWIKVQLNSELVSYRVIDPFEEGESLAEKEAEYIGESARSRIPKLFSPLPASAENFRAYFRDYSDGHFTKVSFSADPHRLEAFYTHMKTVFQEQEKKLPNFITFIEKSRSKIGSRWTHSMSLDGNPVYEISVNTSNGDCEISVYSY